MVLDTLDAQILVRTNEGCWRRIYLLDSGLSTLKKKADELLGFWCR